MKCLVGLLNYLPEFHAPNQLFYEARELSSNWIICITPVCLYLDRNIYCSQSNWTMEEVFT